MSLEAVFGEVLREARVEAGLSQERLAEASDCTRPYVSYLETGRYSASMSVLFRLSAALSLPASTLISRVEQRLRDAPERSIPDSPPRGIGETSSPP